MSLRRGTPLPLFDFFPFFDFDLAQVGELFGQGLRTGADARDVGILTGRSLDLQLAVSSRRAVGCLVPGLFLARDLPASLCLACTSAVRRMILALVESVAGGTLA